MEGDFRNTLIIISAIVIAGIFIHGFITIRKNKNPYKLKTIDEKIEPVERGFDGSGFDQDGVSNIRVVGEQTPEQVKQNLAKEAAQALERKLKPNYKPAINTNIPFDDEPVIDSFDYSTDNINDSKAIQQDISLTDVGVEDNINDKRDALNEVGDDIADFDYAEKTNTEQQNIKRVETPLYDTPITQEKPTTKSKPFVNVSKKPTDKKKGSVKRNQIELNFGEPLEEGDMPSMRAIDDSPKQTAKEKERPSVEPEVLAVSVVMPDGEEISGAALLPVLLTLGLKFGDMDIFHRHQDNAGTGKVTFSLANIMNPGTFDLDALESFNTRGVTLFMTLPNAGDSFEVFQHMLNAAKQISIEFGAQLLDDKRSVMTKQTEQHYTSKIREFERKKRIAYA